MDEKRRKIELAGLRKTLAAILKSDDLDKENETVKSTVEQLKTMIKEREQ